MSKKMLKVKQTGSPLRRPKIQRETLKGLGLNKIGRVRVLEDTDAVRGMIRKVAHMVSVEKDEKWVDAEIWFGIRK